ncbi:KRAB-A domain-containing protein 2-like [Acyrthosiphon pisum]|uniref:Integrase catalytic domain-containing protein n=1 Tax=Acyrthosiphon pisum TaxID=7029 RepID=A0A8R2FC90_ACYPI|nr:KRAB-A domain-containing protein 2-like [Acyrthosiphon pisum]|eukprot:XP_008187612.1 PREDICTED: KRAB-A domain-containing protein 2-like [Acyrthosiphon pisum]
MNRKLVIKPIISKNFNERGQVDLVDFQSLPDGKFKWILNYQDHRTKVLSLRPLESKRTSEVANNLLSIFLTFSAPKILQSDNGREFVNSIIIELKELWPDCVIVHGRPRYPQSQRSIERSNQDIENMLRAWMKDNKTKKWSIGLQFVQFQKNSSHHRVIECCMEPHSVEAILCNLCEKNIKIKEARHLGAIGIEKQAEKMLQDSKIKISTFKVGDCVVISIPKVDRGPAYPANIIGVVIDQKNYHIGTEHNILKGWYGSGNIQTAEREKSGDIDCVEVTKKKQKKGNVDKSKNKDVKREKITPM